MSCHIYIVLFVKLLLVQVKWLLYKSNHHQYGMYLILLQYKAKIHGPELLILCKRLIAIMQI